MKRLIGQPVGQFMATLLVEVPLAAGLTAVVLRLCRQAKHLRLRYVSPGAKCDCRDAFVLASALRTV
jgi:hypothetical protein